MPERDTHQHGVHARLVIAALAGILLTVTAVCAVVYGLVERWGTPRAGANAPMEMRIPGPNLRSAPQADTPPSGASAPEVVQRVGAQLPLDARFRDEAGRESALSRYLGDRPAVLVFGYYRCPNLCTTLMEGVLVAADAMKLDASAYDIVGIGIDPRETADDALRKARAYRVAYAGAALHLLTGTSEESGRVAAAAGLHYAYDRAIDQYAHPLAVLVVAPDGRISRYFAGVQLDPRELRLALVEASAGRLGSLTDRFFLRCAHFDPRTGRYSIAAMTFVRAGCLLVLAALGAWVWRRRR